MVKLPGIPIVVSLGKKSVRICKIMLPSSRVGNVSMCEFYDLHATVVEVFTRCMLLVHGVALLSQSYGVNLVVQGRIGALSANVSCKVRWSTTERG